MRARPEIDRQIVLEDALRLDWRQAVAKVQADRHSSTMCPPFVKVCCDVISAHLAGFAHDAVSDELCTGGACATVNIGAPKCVQRSSLQGCGIKWGLGVTTQTGQALLRDRACVCSTLLLCTARHASPIGRVRQVCPGIPPRYSQHTGHPHARASCQCSCCGDAHGTWPLVL